MNPNHSEHPLNREVYILRFWNAPTLHGQIIQVSSGHSFALHDPQELYAFIQAQIQSSPVLEKSTGLK